METIAPNRPHETDLQEAIKPFDSGLSSELLAHEGLELYDLASGPAEIDLYTIKPLETSGDSVLLGVMDIAGRGVKILGVTNERGQLDTGYVCLAPGDYDPVEERKKDLNEAQIINLVPVMAGREPITVGRTSKSGARLGLDQDMGVSREHFSVEITREGKLRIEDKNSTNGTSLVTSREDIDSVEGHPISREIKIHNTEFSIEGAFPVSGRGDVFVIASRDKEGIKRRFMVYKSMSEGGWRSSQGFEPDHRFMKGAESSPYTQYTQDTQLHPEFADFITSLSKSNEPLEMVNADSLMYSGGDVEWLLEDFQSEVKVKGWDNAELNNELFKTKAGMFKVAHLLSALKEHNPKKIPKALKKHVETINEKLIESDAIPSFDIPERVEHDVHGSLGPITREVYSKTVSGRKIEWHMAHDKNGRVWIDRMRFADSKATPYGTDKELVYSGILTSKPIEYEAQVAGLPEEFKSGKIGRSYEDISKFLDTFAPVQQYRAKKGMIR